MKIGIIGLPNVGKSTLFNAITNAGAASANYPFCTVEPNIGIVAVPDERLKKLAGLGLVAAGGIAVSRKLESPEKKAQRQQNKIDAERNKTYFKQSKRNARREGRREARREGKLRNINTTDNYISAKKEVNANRKNPGFFSRFIKREDLDLLLEYYTPDQILYCLDEEKKEDKQKLVNSYNKYVEKCIDKGKDPMTYKEYKIHKKKVKKNIKKAIVAAGIASYAIADHNSVKSGKGHITRRIRNARLDSKLEKKMDRRNDDTTRYIRNRANTNYNVGRIHQSNINGNGRLAEDLALLENYDMDEYLYKLNNDVDFNKRSYHSYCVMMESRGLTPLDENVFSDAKEKIASYSKAAIEGIKKEKIKKEKKLEELEKKKAEEKKKKEEAEKEMLKNMTPEQKKSYLKKKAKEEEEEEQKKQDKHDIKQTFKKGLASGSGEELGKSAVKLASKVFLR